MARRYVADYRLDNIVGPSGKVKTVPVYCGDWFEFEASEAEITKAKRLYLALTALAALSLGGLLCLTNHMARAWYVTLPAALSLLFLGFAALATYRLWTANGPVTREHRDKTHDRMASMSLITTILAGLCLIGCAYHLIAVAAGLMQLLFTLLALIYFICALCMFLRKGVLKMKKSDKKRYEIEGL